MKIEEYLSIQQAAAIAGVTDKRIWQLIKDGKLSTQTIAGRQVAIYAEIKAYQFYGKAGRPKKTDSNEIES